MIHHPPLGNAGCHSAIGYSSSETRTIEIDDSIVRKYPSDTERDRESYTEVCDVCLSRPIILDVQACPILTKLIFLWIVEHRVES
jgi:hypothetical protein